VKDGPEGGKKRLKKKRGQGKGKRRSFQNQEPVLGRIHSRGGEGGRRFLVEILQIGETEAAERDSSPVRRWRNLFVFSHGKRGLAPPKRKGKENSRNRGRRKQPPSEKKRGKT